MHVYVVVYIDILVTFKSLAAVTMHIGHHIITSMSLYNEKSGYSDMSFPTIFELCSLQKCPVTISENGNPANTILSLTCYKDIITN